ncbi:MAG: NAD(P)H-dependent oxidoreductase [Actinobacteria bacterium]|nr:MAG: NAD(P)H-dependent oxidoreductase [Actinomycetota bacterium]
MYRLQIITGSIRPNRLLDSVTPWVVRHARAHGAFDVEVLDLREWALPMFAEHAGSIGDPTDPTYSDPVVKRWNTTIAAGDGYLFVTPEYNHSVPAVLKNALETVFASFAFRNKPAGFVGYSTGIAGGARAVEHLTQITVDQEMVPLRTTVLLGQAGRAFGDDGEPADPASRTSLAVMLDDLAWWIAALARARAAGELPPARVRMAAATAARR